MKNTYLAYIALTFVAMTFGSCSQDTPITPQVVVVGLELDHLPSKVDYYVGEAFDVSGLTLKVISSDKSSRTVAVEKGQVTGFDSTVPNPALVLQVKESGLVVEFSVEILANYIPLLSVKSLPQKTVYTMDEPLLPEGLVLQLTHKDGTTEDISPINADRITGFDSSAPSLKQTLKVSIDDNEVTFDVTVLPIEVVNNEIIRSVASADIKSFSIPEGITAIKDGAFFDNQTIEELIFPTSLNSIGQYAFTNCVNLKSADLSRTSISVLCSEVFDRSGLETIFLPSTLKIIEGMALSNTTRLKEVILPEGVEQIGLTAFSRSGLETITIPNTVCYIDRAFYECKQLKTVRTAGEKLTLNFNKEAIIESGCFDYSPNIEVLEIPGSITIIGRDVLGVCKVKTLVLPASVKTLERFAFGNASLLSEITFHSPTIIDASDKSIPSTIQTIKVPAQLVDQYKNDPYWRNFASKIIAL